LLFLHKFFLRFWLPCSPPSRWLPQKNPTSHHKRTNEKKCFSVLSFLSLNSPQETSPRWSLLRCHCTFLSFVFPFKTIKTHLNQVFAFNRVSRWCVGRVAQLGCQPTRAETLCQRPPPAGHKFTGASSFCWLCIHLDPHTNMQTGGFVAIWNGVMPRFVTPD
jgi:hypothetical protein